MQKRAVIFSASEYLNSQNYPKPMLDLSGVNYDISAIEKRLIQISFNVTKKENIEKAEYFDALHQSVENCPDDTIHIVYFSGHGGHCNGKNYIYPSDFTTRYDDSKNIDDAGINIADIISVYKGKGKLILIIDACRSEFPPSKGYFSEMSSSENVYIAYGTMFQKNSTAIKNNLSWFTETICDVILTPNIDVDTLFTQVRQNIFTKHYVQVPVSVNGLLEKVILHSVPVVDDIDKMVYDFVEKYGVDYTDQYGYLQGDDLIFIDAAQYLNIGLLDAIWKFRKATKKTYKEQIFGVPELSEAEEKLVSFLNFTRSPKFFTCDESHTWYYNGRQIRMGEIPPLPPSMQRKLPDKGNELHVSFKAKKEGDKIILETNLPEPCELFVWDNKSKLLKRIPVCDGKIILPDADQITKVEIDSMVFTSDIKVQQIIGNKSVNLVGEFVKYRPITGNKLTYVFEV